MMATIRDIRHKPSGTYATAERGGEQFTVMLNHKLPRWDDINSGTYVDIDPDEWGKLKVDASKVNPIYK